MIDPHCKIKQLKITSKWSLGQGKTNKIPRVGLISSKARKPGKEMMAKRKRLSFDSTKNNVSVQLKYMNILTK